MADGSSPLSPSEMDILLTRLNQNPAAADADPGAAAGDQAAAVASTPWPAGPPASPRLADSPELRKIADLSVTFESLIGSTRMTLKEVLGLGIGSRIVLNERWSEPTPLRLNRKPVGKAQVVLVGNRFGVRIVEWGKPRRNPGS